MGSPINDCRGKLIENFLEENNLVCLNKGESTHLNYSGTLSHLDLALCTRNLTMNTDCWVMNDNWGSDHFPLLLQYSEEIPRINMNSGNKFNLKKADWALYKQIIQHVKHFDSEVNDLDQDYASFVAILLDARDKSIPKKMTNFKHKYSPYWNKDCSKAKLLRKQAEKP